MLGDFMVKNSKLGKEDLYLTENRFSRNKMWYTADNHNYMDLICVKGFVDLKFE